MYSSVAMVWPRFTVAPTRGVKPSNSTRALAGYTFTVQYRFKPTGSNKWTSWTTWQNAVSATSARFTPNQGAGTYDFHALIRNTSTGRVSTNSPDSLITLS